jgi:hypothetical protein
MKKSIVAFAFIAVASFMGAKVAMSDNHAAKAPAPAASTSPAAAGEHHDGQHDGEHHDDHGKKEAKKEEAHK